MDDDVKARFEEIDKRMATTDKRFDDVKWFAGGVSLLLAVVAVIAGLNFSNERSWLRESVREIKEEAGKLEAPPVLEILGSNGQTLTGQEVTGQIHPAKTVGAAGEVVVAFQVINRNSGNGSTGPLWIKAYSSDPIRLTLRSTDESRFSYEDLIAPKESDPSELPGSMTVGRRVWLSVTSVPPPGKYPMMLKFYYGKGKVVSATFVLVIT